MTPEYPHKMNVQKKKKKTEASDGNEYIFKIKMIEHSSLLSFQLLFLLSGLI